MPFIPRTSVTSPSNMVGNSWWYSSGNPFYNTPYFLPNCTAYAYGRYAEIRNGFANLPTVDAQDWYSQAQSLGFTTNPTTPKLGAIACWTHPTSGGHVAIVESINQDGSLNLSNSAYGGDYFIYTINARAPQYLGESFTTYTDTGVSQQYQGSYLSNNYTFLGFIYNDYEAVSVSDYVIAALCGCANSENGVNPAAWQNYVASTWDNTDEMGYGIFAWTNTTGSAILETLHSWVLSHGYTVDEVNKEIPPDAQLNFFVSYSMWGGGSGTQFPDYNSLEEFLSADSSTPNDWTFLNNLVYNFLYCYLMGGWYEDPSSIELTERQYAAQIAYNHIQQHKNDNPSSYNWFFENRNITKYPLPQSASDTLSSQTYNNIMCMYFWFQGYSPSPEPPTPPTPTTRRGMPLWMMLRYY